MTQGCVCPPTAELTCKGEACPRRAAKRSDWANSKEREDFLDRAYFEGRMSGRIRPGGWTGSSHPSFHGSASAGPVTPNDPDLLAANEPFVMTSDPGAMRGR